MAPGKTHCDLVAAAAAEVAALAILGLVDPDVAAAEIGAVQRADRVVRGFQ